MRKKYTVEITFRPLNGRAPFQTTFMNTDDYRAGEDAFWMADAAAKKAINSERKERKSR
jgi:hypothetical protein